MREMKDSGIEWIGEIPKEWEVSTIKQEYLFQTGGTPKTDIESYFEGENIWVNISDMKSKFITDSVKHISDDAVNSTSMSISPKGSLLYAFKLSVGAVAFCKKDMYTNEAIATFLPCKNSLEYLYYTAPIFIIMNANENIYGAKLLNQKLIKNAKIIIPPLAEQQKISAYLDTKCAKIDSIIEKQEKVIEKLKAYKLSVITEAVTKGLNPDVKMKDSGVEWIGEIPESWEIGKVGYFTTKIGSGKTPKGGAEIYVNDGVLFLRSQNIYDDGLKIEDATYITEEIDDEMANTKVFKNDVLLNITGGSIGRSCIYNLNEHANVNQHVCIIRTIKTNILPEFMHYFWISDLGHTAISICQTGANREGMNFEQISKTPIPVVPLNEQVKICNHLDKKCSAINKSIKQKQAIIEKLKEYKKSLIYEVVTGKKEVYSTKKTVTVFCPVGIPSNEKEYARMLLMQKILIRCGDKLKGRTHFMKIFHAIELGVGFSFCSEYTRHIHGPYDNNIEEYENALVHKGWIKLEKGGNVGYIVVNPTAYKMDYNRIFAEYNKDIERIIDFFKQMKRTSKAEKVATLLASWNDFLIDGIVEPTDDMIITDVMTNWTENKKNIDYATWQRVLDQMKTANIVPHGYGRHTIRMEN